MKCTICNSEMNHYFTFNYYVDFYKCENCEFIIRIPENNLVNYSDGYEIQGLQKKVEVLSKGYYNEINNYINDNADVLEIGGSYGSFLKLLKEKKNCTVTNYELSTNAVDFCNENGINATSDINDLKNKKYDVIISFHVLEHIESFELDKFLERFFGRLNNGGLFISISPNGNAGLFSLFKKYYSWIAFPEHTVFFTEKSVKEVAQKYNLKLLLNKSKIPNLIHYPSFSIMKIIVRKIMKTDEKFEDNLNKLSKSKQNESSIKYYIKKIFFFLFKVEAYFHMIYLLPFSKATKNKEEIVFVLKKD